ncbi:MAG: hypothetical protein WC631_00080 [Candidatus Paceibacterota bacterium]|jgi:hypothetical protein
MIDKWILILFLFIVLCSVSAILARRQGMKKNEQSDTNLSADDFKILE